MQPESNKTIVQAVILRQTEKIILMLAEAENRSKSNMISTLIDEALEQRSRKEKSKT